MRTSRQRLAHKLGRETGEDTFVTWTHLSYCKSSTPLPKFAIAEVDDGQVGAEPRLHQLSKT
jgi:hypothetical protein